MNELKKTSTRSRVLACLADAAETTAGIDAEEIAQQTGIDRKAVRTALTNLVTQCVIYNAGTARAAQHLPGPKPEPAKPEPAKQAATIRAISSANGHGTYTGAELKHNPGLQPSRHAADIPSRVGERLYWPGGRVTQLCGKPCKASA